MKLLTINQARAIWLFPLSDLNPRGKALERSGLLEIGNRYGFALVPTQTDIVVAREKNQPIKYLQGAFSPKGKEPITVDLLIYRDGIVADTRSSTSDSSDFIADLLRWASEEFGLLPYEGIVKNRLTVSDIHVSTDRVLALLNPKLAAFSKLLTSKVHGHHGAQYEPAAIGFWADQNVPTQPPAFRFERVVGTPFAENRYFSIAPLETDEHLELLDKLEALLTG